MAKQKRYVMAHGATINKNCSVEFGRTDKGKLHVKIITFGGKESVVLTEKTLEDIYATLEQYREEVSGANAIAN